MAIKELDGGQSHTFSPTALRVTLTGGQPAQPPRLRVVDQAGADSVAHRLGSTEVVLTPQPRRLRLMAVPEHGGAFAPGTHLGLTIRTEGAAATSEQVLVSSFDVGALTDFEFGVLEFAQTKAVLRVSEAPDEDTPITAPTQPVITSGEAFSGAASSGPPPARVQQDDMTWLEPSRYALRDAAKVGEVGTPSASWGLVLDSSASMRQLHRAGQLQPLVSLVLGSHVLGARTWPQACVTAGVRVLESAAKPISPEAFLGEAYDDTEPASWAPMGLASRHVAQAVGHAGTVLVVTDGVPGDVANLVDLAQSSPQVHLALVTLGVSTHNLPSDGGCSWWEEELAGLSPLDALPNVKVSAVRRARDGRLELGGSRAAELALFLSRVRGAQG